MLYFFSNASNESDLIGIENLSQLRSEYFSPADYPDQHTILNNEVKLIYLTYIIIYIKKL